MNKASTTHYTAANNLCRRKKDNTRTAYLALVLINQTCSAPPKHNHGNHHTSSSFHRQLQLTLYPKTCVVLRECT